MKKADLVLAIQKFGKEVNPAKKHADLVAILKDLKANEKSSTTEPIGNTQPLSTTLSSSLNPPTENVSTPPELSDTQKILNMLGGVVDSVKSIDKRLTKVETGDANAYKEGAKTEDIESAQTLNQKVDKRIVAIVEKTLGVDFGVEMEGYDDKPGMLLSILVPKRLSPIPTAFRPVMDPETRQHKLDPDTKRVLEEEYWPGDKRSVAMGANDSFDVVQKHANRIRSFIMATYQKTNQPQPDFRTRA